MATPRSTFWLPPAEQLVAFMARIYRHRMTTTSGGNLSILSADGSLWITPARVDKGSLTARDIVQVRPDGSSAGLHPPSSELPFHQAIYRRRPDIKALVHAHPGALVAFSVARRLPETRLETNVHETCGQVVFAPYACPGTKELGENIAAAFAGGADCVLLENHGVVVGGRTLAEAFQRFETLEFAARTHLIAASLGPIRPLPTATVANGASRPRLGSFTPPEPDDHERQLRADICRLVHRAYEQRLLISAAGAFSARVAADRFVITPSRIDRLTMEPETLVGMTFEAAESGRTPSRAAALHAAIYRRHPEVGAILNAQPIHATAFCVTDHAFSTHTIPESYVVLREVARVGHHRIVEDAEKLAAVVDPQRQPVALIANEGAVVLGKNPIDAFDRLEVLEATCEAIVLARPLNSLVTMPPSAIDELRRAFGVP